MHNNLNCNLRNSTVSHNQIRNLGTLLLFAGIVIGLFACANRTEHTFEQPKVIPDVVTIRSAINDIIPIGTGEEPIDYQKRDPLTIPETLDELPDPNDDIVAVTEDKLSNKQADSETNNQATDQGSTNDDAADSIDIKSEKECDDLDPKKRCSLIEPPIEYNIPPDNSLEESDENSS